MDDLFHDSGWHLLSDDPAAGIRRFATVDVVDGKVRLVVKTETYVIDQILTANAAARAETDGQKWGDFCRYGSVPIDIWNRELDQAHRAGDEKYLTKWFNDGDHAAFRTKEGRV